MIESFPLHTYDTYILTSINYGVDAVFGNSERMIWVGAIACRVS